MRGFVRSGYSEAECAVHAGTGRVGAMDLLPGKNGRRLVGMSDRSLHSTTKEGGAPCSCRTSDPRRERRHRSSDEDARRPPRNLTFFILLLALDTWCVIQGVSGGDEADDEKEHTMTSTTNHRAALAFLTVARTCLSDAQFASTARDVRVCTERALEAAGCAMEVCDVTDTSVYSAAQEIMDAAVDLQLAARAR